MLYVFLFLFLILRVYFAHDERERASCKGLFLIGSDGYAATETDIFLLQYWKAS